MIWKHKKILFFFKKNLNFFKNDFKTQKQIKIDFSWHNFGSKLENLFLIRIWFWFSYLEQFNSLQCENSSSNLLSYLFGLTNIHDLCACIYSSMFCLQLFSLDLIVCHLCVFCCFCFFALIFSIYKHPWFCVQQCLYSMHARTRV